MLAFGFDEETRGVRGAVKIAEALEKAWGRGGFALVLDEGGMALTNVGGHIYARPDVAQKGYMDALLILETSGGHHSRPPAHSGIGIIAEMIVALEQNPYTPVLTRRTSEAFWSAKPSISLQNWNRGFDVLCSATTTVQRLERKLTERGPQTRLSMQAWQAVDI